MWQSPTTATQGGQGWESPCSFTSPCDMCRKHSCLSATKTCRWLLFTVTAFATPVMSAAVTYNTKMWKWNHWKNYFAFWELNELKCFKSIDGKRTENGVALKNTLSKINVSSSIHETLTREKGSMLLFLQIFSSVFAVSANSAQLQHRKFCLTLTLSSTLRVEETLFVLTNCGNFSTPSWTTPFSRHVHGQNDTCLSNLTPWHLNVSTFILKIICFPLAFKQILSCLRWICNNRHQGVKLQILCWKIVSTFKL